MDEEADTWVLTLLRLVLYLWIFKQYSLDVKFSGVRNDIAVDIPLWGDTWMYLDSIKFH